MTIAPHSGIIDFGTFTPPTVSRDGIQGEVPAPLIAEITYVLSATGWVPMSGGGGGTVTMVSGTGTVNGITLTGTVTNSGSLTLGGALSGVSLTTQVSGILPVANGGTGAITLTGYVKGSGTTALTASATIPASDISSGAALTKTDDTNVTLTLGGSPTTALLSATSITAGWTGQLSVARGGTGAATLTGYVKGTGTAALTASSTIPASDIGSGAALTKTDDTNVTLTLGGTPASALLAATSITAGWTGQLSVARGGTGASTLTGVVIGNGTSAFTTVTAPSGDIVGTTDTQTLTNKRLTPRVLASTADSATPTLNTNNYDMMVITGQTVTITSFTTNLSGTPTNGQKLWISITGTGAIAITWGASFEASTIALPTTTVTTNRLDVGFVWNAATSKWRCVATA